MSQSKPSKAAYKISLLSLKAHLLFPMIILQTSAVLNLNWENKCLIFPLPEKESLPSVERGILYGLCKDEPSRDEMGTLQMIVTERLMAAMEAAVEISKEQMREYRGPRFVSRQRAKRSIPRV